MFMTAACSTGISGLTGLTPGSTVPSVASGSKDSAMRSNDKGE